MEREETPYIMEGKARKGRTVRVLRINRVVAIMLLLGIIAGGITVFFAIRSNNAYKVDARSYFYLQMGEFTTGEQAAAKSNELKGAGACGYIVNDGVFRVMATVYRTKAEAELVMIRLNSSGMTATIYEYKVPKFKVNKYDNQTEAKMIRSLIVYPASLLFPQLQKLDMDLDKGEISESAALLGVANIKKELADNREEVITYLAKYPADKALNACEKMYRDIAAAFEDYLPVSELNVGTNIKSILCGAVEIYKNCITQLA